MRRLTAPLLSLALLGVVHVGGAPPAAAAPLGAVAGPVASAAALAARGEKRRTPYAFNAGGFGSQFVGGDLPLNSGKTAFTRIGCTNLAGLNRSNYITEVAVPDSPFSLGGVDTNLRTRAKGRGASTTYSSIATQKVADLKLVDTPLGGLSVSGLTSKAVTSAKRGRFSVATDINIAGITLTPPVGEPQTLRIPTPNRPLTIPGVAVISLGKPVENVGRARASAFASVLQVRTLFGSNPTTLTVANAKTAIERGVEGGIFSGYSAGLEAGALGDIVKVGRNPLRKMPCTGTRGELQQTNLVDLDLAGLVVAKAARAEQRTQTRRGVSSGFERGSVARLNLGDGALVVTGIVGKASVTRKGATVVRKATGGVGSITVNGETATFPRTGVLEVPGLASIEQRVVKRFKTGLQVIGLQVTLLDGSGAVIDLGKAQMKINRGVR
ncbi:hypothetical protein ENKNEFLB_04249 [Nocardioides aquaticus]|uniref:DUF2993 domain-containing protein n=1 Tax=Nocardioides aquaticus TaxID=160826 RepID=A0ABX8EMW3_9ACTN|nr:choice-of-anchor P family protein [Nocardioides aquaticus]QVT81831.1 hypothetical protein ENKNEFLB_04249 [Nocardioides aquaticus]